MVLLINIFLKDGVDRTKRHK